MLRDLALGILLCSFWWFGAQVARLPMNAYVSAQAACDELCALYALIVGLLVITCAEIWGETMKNQA